MKPPPSETISELHAHNHDLIEKLAQARAAARELEGTVERLRAELADCTRRYTDLLDQLGAGADM